MGNGDEAGASRVETRRGVVLGAVSASVLMMASSNVMAKSVTTTGLVTSFYRLWFAVPILWIMVLAIPSLRHRLNQRWLAGSVFGGLIFGVHQICFFTAIELTTVADVALIGALQPLLVLVVAGPLFGETATRSAVAWSLVAVGGVVLAVVGAVGAPGWSAVGDALAVANLLTFTAYFLASKFIRNNSGATEYLLGMTTVAGFVLLVAVAVTEQDLGSPVGGDWVMIFAIAMIPGTLGHLLTNWAHPHTSAFVISIMYLAVPVFSCVGAAIFLGETLTFLQVLGGAIVLFSVGAVVASVPRRAGGELAESAAETVSP